MPLLHYIEPCVFRIWNTAVDLPNINKHGLPIMLSQVLGAAELSGIINGTNTILFC